MASAAARPVAGTGCAVGGGARKAPEPSRVRVGDRAGVSVAGALEAAAPASEVRGASPASATVRRSISTNRPEIGRFDHTVSAVTWNRTSRPWPSWRAVTSGVPSPSTAQVRLARSGSGSARTCRLTTTSSVTGSPANGLSGGNWPSGCGVDHASAPPSTRPPRRSRTGTRSSFSAAARRVPAKRRSMPPFCTQVARASLACGVSVPTSASAITGTPSSMKRWIESDGEPPDALRTSAKGSSARLQVIDGRNQGLGRVRRRAGDDADGAAAPAFVEKLHAARRAAIGQFDAGDLVAELQRHFETCLRLRFRSPRRCTASRQVAGPAGRRPGQARFRQRPFRREARGQSVPEARCRRRPERGRCSAERGR